ncbi:hypothetical protein D2F24_19910 [Salmonella enterica]|nr:hypothetical protein [Salmonella enterica]
MIPASTHLNCTQHKHLMCPRIEIFKKIINKLISSLSHIMKSKIKSEKLLINTVNYQYGKII